MDPKKAKLDTTNNMEPEFGGMGLTKEHESILKLESEYDTLEGTKPIV